MHRRKMPAIIISGMAASGKTTLAHRLARKCKIRFYSGSDALRELAKEEGYHPKGVDWWDTKEGMEFLGKRSGDHSFDKKVDKVLLRMVRRGSIVITSWALPYIGSPGAKIWLNASKKNRIRRMARRDRIPFKEAKKLIEKRDRKNTELYRDIYGFILGTGLKKFYDVVVDTDGLDEKGVFRKICRILEENFL